MWRGRDGRGGRQTETGRCLEMGRALRGDGQDVVQTLDEDGKETGETKRGKHTMKRQGGE